MEGPSLLAAYLKQNKLSMRAFGAKVEAPASLVCRWANDEGAPGVSYALAIDEATSGAVPFHSWDDRPGRRIVRRSTRRPTGKVAHNR